MLFKVFSFLQNVSPCGLQIIKLMYTGHYKLLCQSGTLCITDLNTFIFKFNCFM